MFSQASSPAACTCTAQAQEQTRQIDSAERDIKTHKVQSEGTQDGMNDEEREKHCA